MKLREADLVQAVRRFAVARVAVVVGVATTLWCGGANAQVLTLSPGPSGSNSASASSWLAGGHAGYNWQQGMALFGIETDLQGTDLNSSMSGAPTLPPGYVATASSTVNWYGTLRGRLGVASGPWLLYGTAGLAYGGVDLNSSFSALSLTTSAQASQTRAGWVAGAGVEYLLRPDLGLSLGYQYVDLGRLSASSMATNTFGTATIAQSATTHAQFQAVMAGISWHFGPMGPATPWAGGYVGGHAGGDWGNDASASYSTAAIFVSDARLKRDIALVGRRADGLGIYSYRYLWSDAVYVGVLAQEVALRRPEAVVRDPLSGYLGVDYGRLP